MKPETVLFLGAGASQRAGYPLASGLLPAVKKAALETRGVQFKGAWKEWEEFREGTEGLLRRLLSNPNPEVVLSVVDLMDVGVTAEDEDQWAKDWVRAQEDMEGAAESQERHYADAGRDALTEARKARRRLLTAVDEFFAGKHYAETKPESRARRDYLRDRLLPELQNGDAVVTTNWDTMAEWILGGEGLWSPFSGYGFRCNLADGLVPYVTRPLPEDLPKDSQITLLKLHGSYGWRRKDDEHIYLEHARFLQHLPFRFDKTDLCFRDAAEPDIGVFDELALLYPSYLKQIRGPELQEIWYLAGQAFNHTKRVKILGYSLPLADGAVRSLLVPLRFRLSDNDVEVEVVDRSSAVLSRWEEFLGRAVKLTKEEV